MRRTLPARIRGWMLLSLLATLLSACHTVRSNGLSDTDQLIATTYQAADALYANWTKKEIDFDESRPIEITANNYSRESNGPIIVATLVDIKNLEQTSNFGRFTSELLASRLSQLGAEVLEIKLRNTVFIRQNEGEFMLTREVQELAATHKVAAVLVGTYTENGQSVFASLKLVRPEDGKILAAYDYAQRKDNEIAWLLGDKSHAKRQTPW
jgi:TolB-like protein